MSDEKRENDSKGPAAGSAVPNPGSDAAIAMGCRCPVLDNNHGHFASWPDGGFWISGDCQLYNVEASKASARQRPQTQPSDSKG